MLIDAKVILYTICNNETNRLYKILLTTALILMLAILDPLKFVVLQIL